MSHGNMKMIKIICTNKFEMVLSTYDKYIIGFSVAAVVIAVIGVVLGIVVFPRKKTHRLDPKKTIPITTMSPATPEPGQNKYILQSANDTSLCFEFDGVHTNLFTKACKDVAPSNYWVVRLDKDQKKHLTFHSPNYSLCFQIPRFLGRHVFGDIGPSNCHALILLESDGSMQFTNMKWFIQYIAPNFDWSSTSNTTSQKFKLVLVPSEF
jgi:hypothetical protein